MSRSFFHNAVRDDRETQVCVEIAVYSWGDLPSFDSLGDGPEVGIVDAWLVADENLPDAPRITLTDAEHERIEAEFVENMPEPDYDE